MVPDGVAAERSGSTYRTACLDQYVCAFTTRVLNYLLPHALSTRAKALHSTTVVECGNANMLGALVAGALPEAERAALANHAASCDHCHALIEGLIETDAADAIAPGPHELLAGGGRRRTDALELGPDTRTGPDGSGGPAVIALGTPEFGGTDRFAVVRRIGAGGVGGICEVCD